MKNKINMKTYNDLIEILSLLPAKKIRYSFRENFEPSGAELSEIDGIDFQNVRKRFFQKSSFEYGWTIHFSLENTILVVVGFSPSNLVADFRIFKSGKIIQISTIELNDDSLCYKSRVVNRRKEDDVVKLFFCDDVDSILEFAKDEGLFLLWDKPSGDVN